MKPRQLLTLLLLIAATALTATARPQREANFNEWAKGMREYKHKFLAKELELTRDQQRKFFVLYDQMEDEMEALNADTRAIEDEVTDKADDATDDDYERAAERLFNIRTREGAIDLKYYDKFKEILTKRQLFQLKGAERKFTREMVKYYRNKRQASKKRPPEAPPPPK